MTGTKYSLLACFELARSVSAALQSRCSMASMCSSWGMLVGSVRQNALVQALVFYRGLAAERRDR